MDSEGFAKVSELLEKLSGPWLNLTITDVRKVVSMDTKQRFELLEKLGGEMLIRCTQGHSKKVADKFNDSRMYQELSTLDMSENTTIMHGTTIQ